MVKYIMEAVNRLTGLSNGIAKNPESWLNQPVKAADVQSKIDALNAKDRELEDAKDLVALKQSEARALAGEAETLADRVENIAIGLENSNQEKLNAYGIKLRKAPAKKEVPAKILIPTLIDDSDGVDFVVATQCDNSADFYEWQKGYAENAAVIDKIPELKAFKTTTKTSFVDDEVPKGIRVYYRVRAVNSTGAGPWSEAVSRVQ